MSVSKSVRPSGLMKIQTILAYHNSTVQYNTVQYYMVQYGTVWYSTVLYGTVQYCILQYKTSRTCSVTLSSTFYTQKQYYLFTNSSTVHYCMILYCTVQCSAVHYSALQYSTVLYSAVLQFSPQQQNRQQENQNENLMIIKTSSLKYDEILPSNSADFTTWCNIFTI